jgi:hypothetical protein
MTANELIERARRQLNAGQPQPHTWLESEIDIAACVMQARNVLAYKVMRDPSRRGLLQQEYTVTLDANGEGDLLTDVGSVSGVAGELLIEGVRLGVVIDTDGNIVYPILNYADFLRPQSVHFPHYTIKDGATILTRAKDTQVTGPLEIVGVNGPLTITASYEPESVEDWPPELEADLVIELVNIVAAKLTDANA